MLLLIYGVAALMVSEIRYYSFKEIRFHHRHPFQVLLGLILLLYLTIGAPQVMLFLGISRLRHVGSDHGDRAAPAGHAGVRPGGGRGAPGLRAIPRPGEAQGPSLLDKPGARR
jgi:hypothetical protein